MKLCEEVFLFRDTPKEKISSLLAKVRAYEYDFSVGEEISYFDGDIRRIGIFLSGEGEVHSRTNESLIHLLGAGSLFGVLSLYSEEEKAPTRIFCRKKAKILFVDARDCEVLLKEGEITKNLVRFLTGRIRFLNEKIASYTAPSARARLALYLLQNSEENGVFEIKTSLSALSKLLGIGRASFYRALEELQKEEAILRSDKTILLNREKLTSLLDENDPQSL